MTTKCCDDPIIPPADCTNICDRYYDSCCIINQANLPCLFPPVVLTGTGVIGSLLIAVSSIAGVLVGMTLYLDDGTVVGVVRSAAGSTITLVDIGTVSFTNANLTGKIINIRQCDFNLAVDTSICNINQGIIPCPVFNDVSFKQGQPITWVNLTDIYPNPPDQSGFQQAQYSNPLQCEIMLRGVIATTIPSQVGGVSSLSIIFQLPVGFRPTWNRKYPATVFVQDKNNTPYIFPGVIQITPLASGAVTLYFIHNLGGSLFPLTVQTSLDNIDFEVTPL